MADWTDGAEYAPVERPAGFATPRTSALPVIEAPTSPAEGHPDVAPGGYDAPSATPLDRLDPREATPRRDPQQPFPGHAAADSAWGAAHATPAWQPTMPLGDPTPTQEPPAPDFPPPQGTPVVPAPVTAHDASTAPPPVVEIPLPGNFPPPTGAPAPLRPPTVAASPVAVPHGAQQPGAPQAPPATQPQAQPAPHQVPQQPVNPFAPAPRNGQQPDQWPARPQPPARRPLPSSLTLTTVVQEAGPLMLAVLAFGAMIPGLGGIMLVISSMLSRRQNPSNALLSALFTVAIWALILSWVASALLSPETSAWSGDLGRWLCALMIPASLGAVHSDLRKRMGR